MMKTGRNRPGLALLLLIVAAFAGLAGLPERLWAQSPSGSPPTIEDSISILQNTIAYRTADRDQLRRMLAALNVIDSVYKPLYPAWLVMDDDLRERVNRAFRQRYPDVPRDTDVVVIANAQRAQILDVSVGATHLGRLGTPQTISDSLNRELLHSSYQRKEVDLAVEPPRKHALDPNPQYASLVASAFGLRLMFSEGLGLDAAIGREELGYHFWSSGDFSIRAVVYGLKLGILLPFPYGYKTTLQPTDPLAIKPSLLIGSTGFSGEFEYPFGDNKAGVRVSVGDLYLGSFLKKAPAGVSAYSLHGTGQIFFGHKVLWGKDSFLFTGGIGYHQVTTNQVDSLKTTLNIVDRAEFTSPILRVDYARLGDRMFGGTIQYYSSILSLTGWVEIVRNFLYVDVKYYTPVFRDPQPWEQKYFFMISPRLQITY